MNNLNYVSNLNHISNLNNTSNINEVYNEIKNIKSEYTDICIEHIDIITNNSSTEFKNINNNINDFLNENNFNLLQINAFKKKLIDKIKELINFYVFMTQENNFGYFSSNILEYFALINKLSMLNAKISNINSYQTNNKNFFNSTSIPIPIPIPLHNQSISLFSDSLDNFNINTSYGHNNFTDYSFPNIFNNSNIIDQSINKLYNLNIGYKNNIQYKNEDAKFNMKIIKIKKKSISSSSLESMDELIYNFEKRKEIKSKSIRIKSKLPLTKLTKIQGREIKINFAKSFVKI